MSIGVYVWVFWGLVFVVVDEEGDLRGVNGVTRREFEAESEYLALVDRLAKYLDR